MLPDDGVLVPGHLCRGLARLATIGLAELSRRDGGLMPQPGLAALLSELDMRASVRVPATLGCTGSSWLSTSEAADLARISAGQVRRLAANGRLIARRHGRDWQVDAASAADYGRQAVA